MYSIEAETLPKFDYELCEKCEKAMEDAGLIGMTTQEMYETDAQFGFDFGLNLMWVGNYIVRESEKDNDHPKVITLQPYEGEPVPHPTIEGVTETKAGMKFAKMDLATDKIISYVELTTEDILAADWTIAKVNEIRFLEEQLEELDK